MDVTTVISPRAHDSAWPRRMIHASTNGALAAARSSHRRIGWTSHAVTDPVRPWISEFGFDASVAYQGRNRLTTSSAPPAIPTNSVARRCAAVRLATTVTL